MKIKLSDMYSVHIYEMEEEVEEFEGEMITFIGYFSKYLKPPGLEDEIAPNTHHYGIVFMKKYEDGYHYDSVDPDTYGKICDFMLKRFEKGNYELEHWLRFVIVRKEKFSNIILDLSQLNLKENPFPGNPGMDILKKQGRG